MGSLSFLGFFFGSLPSFCFPTISQFIVSGDETSNDMQSVFTNLMGDILFVGVDFIVNYSPKLNLHIQGSLFCNCKKKEKEYKYNEEKKCIVIEIRIPFCLCPFYAILHLAFRLQVCQRPHHPHPQNQKTLLMTYPRRNHHHRQRFQTHLLRRTFWHILFEHC